MFFTNLQFVILPTCLVNIMYIMYTFVVSRYIQYGLIFTLSSTENFLRAVVTITVIILCG